MLKHLLTSFLILLLTSSVSFGQFASVKGEVKINGTDSTLGFSTIFLRKDGKQVGGATSNASGAFVIANLYAGNYELEVFFMGYQSYKESFILRSDQTKFISAIMSPLDGNIIVVKIRPRPDVDGGVEIPISDTSIRQGPYVNIIDMMRIDPSTTTTRNGLQFSDARDYQTKMVRNNIEQLGPAIPTILNVGQVRALSKGVPAMYGDFTGGIIEVTTKRILDDSSNFTFQMNTTSLFNPYHHNSFESLWYVPIYKRDSKSIVGLTHSFYIDYKKDDDPFATQLKSVREDMLASINQSPFKTSNTGVVLPEYFFYHDEAFENISAKKNSSSFNIFNEFNVLINPSKSLNFSVQPSFQVTRRHLFSYSNSLFNSDHNPLYSTLSGKLNAQMSHQLKTPYDSKGKLTYDTSWISAANYLIIFDYQRLNTTQEDPMYRDNFFEYGHIGSFKSKGEEIYEYNENTREVEDQYGNKMVIKNYKELAGYQDTAIAFIRTNSSDPRSAFTEAAFQKEQISDLSQLQELQGLINGQNPSSVYGMWYAPGTVVSSFQKSDIQKTAVSAIFNIAIHPTKQLKYQHDLQIGMLFENRKRSSYSLNANGLWRLMPQLLNNQYIKLDEGNPILSYDENGTFTDTVNYNWIIDQNAQSKFDQSLRAMVDGSNGYKSRNAHFIDVNAVSPEQLSLDMFSADELWNNGSAYVNYSGYDHKGKLIRGQKGLNEFLNDKENRYINAFNPIYTALWLQDKFVWDKIDLRVGLRVERYDANQPVLKDPYSLFPIKTAGEVSSINNESVVHPTNIGDDFAVYVDDAAEPNTIVGYRNESNWYDADGNELSTPDLLSNKTSQGRIQPYLVNAKNQELTVESFKDYEPEILILPRLSFSFPINKYAIFYAFYDKFAQRPGVNQSFTPINNYYYIQNNGNQVLPNPALKPSQRTDYQLGFRQAVGNTGLLNVSAGYAEIKDDINLINVYQAYPSTYTTFGNIDFSTIKSFKAEYQTRLNQVYLRASYMLQYADGTGSNVNSAQALIATNQPNLRSLFPLEYDVRHKLNGQVTLNMYGLGGIFKRAIYKNTTLNIFYNSQSGTPYSAYLKPVAEAQSLGSSSRSQLDGNPYGSRLPWNSSLDISIVKGFKSHGRLYEVQLNVVNALNSNNIFKVYSYSSLPSNDGYLSSPIGQQQIASEADAQAFTYMYNLKQNNPLNFGSPRMVSLTVRANF